MAWIGHRGRSFMATFGVSAVAVMVAVVLISVSLRVELLQAIERNLVARTRMAAALLDEYQSARSAAELDAEADRIGALSGARVTFIAHDGRVVGDSAEDLPAIGRLDNHAGRPEIVAARRSGVGVERRHSATVGIDFLYVAVAVRHPSVGVVRLALPLTEVDQQVDAVRRSLLFGLGVALACALVLAWLSSFLLARRVDAIAAMARKYAADDFSPAPADYGEDELGTVARVLDDTARELGRRISEVDQDRARMEAMLAGMLEGVAVVDALGRILLVNDAARRLLRLDATAPGDHYLAAVPHPDVRAVLGGALEGRTPEGLEFSPPHDPGRTVIARAAPIGAAGSRGAVLVLHDITDLRYADRVRRDFVANVSHELRTPLTAIRGYVEALMDDDPPDPAEARRFLEIIARHATRMERLVRDLLRLARLEAGQEPVDRADVSLEAHFAGVVTELSSAIDARRQHVAIAIDPSAGTLATDAEKLHDALRNLLENAIAYAPPGTTIELAARRDNGRTIITVADTGPGIPDADVGRIFERFYRVDKARTRESGGTGLGLSIVKHLIGILGGEVRAANRPAGGAVFTITLP